MKTLHVIIATVIVAAASATAAQAQTGKDSAAEILKEMSDFISSQKTIRITVDSGIEVVTPYLEKLEFNSSSSVLVNRPSQLYAHRVSSHADVELRFDGQSIFIYEKQINGFLKLEAPGNLDDLVKRLREGEGVALPGADLLLSDPYKVLTENALESKYLGPGIIDGAECEHLAFRTFDTDWQLWVRTGDQPIPCKMVVTSKTIAGAPQYTLRIKSWEGVETVDPGLFRFDPPAGSKELGPDSLIMLDELPPQTEN